MVLNIVGCCMGKFVALIWGMMKIKWSLKHSHWTLDKLRGLGCDDNDDGDDDNDDNLSYVTYYSESEFWRWRERENWNMKSQIGRNNISMSISLLPSPAYVLAVLAVLCHSLLVVASPFICTALYTTIRHSWVGKKYDP